MSRVVIASDHAGVALKRGLCHALAQDGHAVEDLGPATEDSVDYPDFARQVVDAMVEGRADNGILICGSGIGMSIAANRHQAIRAALCATAELAALARQHNDANVLCLGARFVNAEAALACARVFLATPFEGGRHQRRVEKLG